MEVTGTTKKLGYVVGAILAMVVILGLMSAFSPNGDTTNDSGTGFSQSSEASPF